MELKSEITCLHNVVYDKEKIICELQDRVGILEISADATWRYSRRANLRVQGVRIGRYTHLPILASASSHIVVDSVF